MLNSTQRLRVLPSKVITYAYVVENLYFANIFCFRAIARKYQKMKVSVVDWEPAQSQNFTR